MGKPTAGKFLGRLGGGCELWFLVLVVINVTVGALATQYVIESWTLFVFDHTLEVPFWPHAMIIGLVAGEITMPVAVITMIIMSLL